MGRTLTYGEEDRQPAFLVQVPKFICFRLTIVYAIELYIYIYIQLTIHRPQQYAFDGRTR